MAGAHAVETEAQVRRPQLGEIWVLLASIHARHCAVYGDAIAYL